MQLPIRPRRLRRSAALRQMVRETRVSPASLIYPIFIDEQLKGRRAIPSLDGQFHYGPDSVNDAIAECVDAGINSCMLFGLPEHKDAIGSAGFDDCGVVQSAIRSIKAKYPDFFVVTDVCMCEYTDHGHCGAIEHGRVSNDASLELLCKVALSHARAGADMLCPSDMMDGRVRAMREALDGSGYEELSIMVHSAKYASAFYGPFREAAGSAPAFGDRRTYQMDFHNRREAVKECRLDIEEGADIIMVKPAMSYLDVVRDCSQAFDVPVAAYSVSGEYAMIKSAGKAGLIDEYAVMCESAASVFRAGASVLVTYSAKELAAAMRRGDLG